MHLVRKLMQKPVFRQFIKYVLVGCVVTAIDMLVLHLLYRELHIHIKVSVIAGFMSGNVSSFVFNKYFTFRNFSKAVIRQYAKYFITSMTGLLWTLFLMTLFYEKLNLFAGITSYNYIICKMIVAVMVMFWNFIIIRHWTLTHYTLPKIQAIPDQKQDRNIFLSIIIPAYNEEKRLPETIGDVVNWVNSQDFSCEIIVVDDGSSDGTVNAVKDKYGDIPFLAVVSLSSNQGKGIAVKEGMLYSSGRYRMFMDADHQIDISELEAFIPKFGDNRVIIGSKYLSNKNTDNLSKISLSRRFISRLGNRIIRILFSLNVQDTQCGFKVFPGSLAENLFRLQKVKRFAFDVELLTLASIYKQEILEMEISLKDSSESRVKTFKDSLNVFLDLVSIKMNTWKKAYKMEVKPRVKSDYIVKKVV